MVEFKNEEAAKRTRERLEELAHIDLKPLIQSAFEDCADPDVALQNLERWLRSTSNPAVYLAHLAGAPRLAKLAILVLGASQPLADSLVQNPELGELILDPLHLARPIEAAQVLEEGRRLLALSGGFSHALDRLRFLKQRWTLSLVVGDLAVLWPEETVWRALSDIADALIELACEAVWTEYAAQKGLRGACPVSVVAFGKLGGRELNYSSDVDLVYVADDDLDEQEEKHASRFSEMLTRAISDRMGRGALYRVDLRLRPFGGAGPIVQRMRAVAAYYASHAQPWETMALIRSRVVKGDEALAARWEKLRNEQCFRPKWSSSAFDEMVEMRRRVEQAASASDLKRAAGGIRDVEFLTQILQLAYGHEHGDARQPNTSRALRALAGAGVLPKEVSDLLIEGYAFLRTLEHRCQLAGDQQTHDVPEEPAARERLGRLMGLGGWPGLAAKLDSTRRAVRSVYARWIRLPSLPLEPRDAVLAELTDHAESASAWFDALPESGGFYRSLAENRDSLGRVRKLLSGARGLVPHLARNVSLTESVISGELEEPQDPAVGLESLAVDSSPSVLGRAGQAAWAAIACRWVLDPSQETGGPMSRLYDAVFRHIARRLYVEFDVVALGSYASGDLGLQSDADLLILVSNPERQADAESQAEQMLALFGSLRRYGAPLSIDLRLRPEGGQGLLARTFAGFSNYELTDMELWERVALGECRIVFGSQEAESLVQKAAYAQPLTPERLEELLGMKRRIEAERVPAKHFRRNVKLGYGGLSDVEWLAHLHEMRFPTATEVGLHRAFPDRIRALGRARLLTALEVESLLDARAHLRAVRDRLVALGFSVDVVPENPDKLAILGLTSGFPDGNSFLARHESVIETVRSIYSECLDRLRV